MTRVVGFGAGGHARVVIEIIQSLHDYEIVGLLDAQPSLKGTVFSGVPVLGDDTLIESLLAQGIRHAFIGLGTIGNTDPRLKLFERVSRSGFDLVSVMHPNAIVSPSVTFGVGPTVMAGAVINANTEVGNNVIVNTGAIVEHDCSIGDHSHISTGARLAGGVRIGRATHVGIGAVIRQGIQVGDDAIIAAGAVVVNDIQSGETVMGVPAKVQSKVNH